MSTGPQNDRDNKLLSNLNVPDDLTLSSSGGNDKLFT